mmetsp:Transcript_96493/g.249495  ORF Transcript_96493/g.249495 Transcript_96493/m.249495 type:complete len:257 (+) Transcript_96493:282-1052(+)
MLLVLIHHPGPVEILTHSVLLHLVEDWFPVMVDLQRLVNLAAHLMLVEAAEEEASGGMAIPLILPEPLNRVLQPTSLMHDRQRSVSLGVHLWQPARLVLGRHQQDIATRHHAVLHSRVEADVATEAALVAALHLGHPGLVLRLPLAHDDELDATGALAVHHPLDVAQDQGQTLLVAETAAEADEAGPWVLVEPKLLLQRSLALGLPLLVILNAVVPRDVLVGPRVPLIGDAVQDAGQAQAASLPLQNIIQAAAALG